MKLNIVPARTGYLWVKLGIKAFARQPLALSGLFFMFMAVMSICTLVPFLGSLLALTLLPGATLGLMAATRETENGKFPTPAILVSAFRAGRQRLQTMLLLGAFYAVGFLLVMAASALVDGGQFARLYLVGGNISPEMLEQADFQTAVWTAFVLYLPLSMLFWHAPGLVHWHGVSPVKSLFFSAVACLRNFGAFFVFVLVWTAMFATVGLVLILIAGILGMPGLVMLAWFPVAMLMLAIFFCSIYFTFRDCFVDATTGP